MKVTQTNEGGVADVATPKQGSALPKVLLVDDQPARLLTYEAVLEGIGVCCVRALSGTEALQKLLAEEFAVIVLDVQMPEMDGFEVARHIREHPRFEQTPIIFVTGVNISDLDRLRGYEVGAIDYLPLPIVPEILRSKVALLVELYTRRAELKMLNHKLETARASLEEERNDVIRQSRTLQKESDDQFSALIDHPTEHSILIEAVRDSAGNVTHWRCLDANSNSLRALKRTRLEVVGSKLADILPEHADQLGALGEKVLLRRGSHRFESEYDGRRFRNLLVPVGERTVAVSGVDITDSVAGIEDSSRHAALQLHDAWITTLLESMQDEVYFTNLDGKYTYANEAAIREFGHFSLAGVEVSQALKALEVFRVDGSTRPIDEAPPLRALAGEIVRDEEQLVRHPASMELRNRRVSAFPARNDAGEIVGSVAIARDITIQKRAEQESKRRRDTTTALLQLADRFRPLTEPADLAFSAAELLGQTLAVSRCGYGTIDHAAETITIERDWNAEGISSLAGVLHFRDYGTYIDELKRGETVVCNDATTDPRTSATAAALRSIQVQSFVNMPITEREGAVALLYLNHAQPREWLSEELAFMREIAERTRLAVERRRNEQALATDFECMGRLRDLSARLVAEEDPAVLFDEVLAAATFITAADCGSIQRFDSAAGELLLTGARGFDEAMIKRFERVGPTTGSSCGRALVSRRREFVGYEVMDGPDPDGTKEYLRSFGLLCAQSTPLLSRSGELLGMFSTHWRCKRVITEREYRFLDLLARQAADLIERNEADRALREADRRKDEFIALLSHELRNPLVPIRNGINLLKRVSDPEGVLAKLRPMMERQISHTVRLVDDLLDVSRLTSGRMELTRAPARLDSIVSAAIEAHREQMEASRIVLAHRVDDFPAEILVDAARVTQVVSNLLSNAIKFSLPDGRIELDARIEKPGDRSGSTLIVSVRDWGEGIAAERLAGVFDLFASAARTSGAFTARSGLGVGLALARRIVELHGGTLSVESAGVGMGAVFTLKIPVDEQDAAPPPSPGTGELAAELRVLVVDDNVDAANSMVMLLRSMGIAVQAAYDGHSALEAVEKSAPSLVLLDLGMPVMDGYEVHREMRKRFGDKFRIVAVTGWGLERDKRRTAEAGFDAHLTKPVEAEVLAETIRTVSMGRVQ